MRYSGSRWKLIPPFFFGRCLARKRFIFMEKLYCVFPRGKNRGAGFWWPPSKRSTPLCWPSFLRSKSTQSCPSGCTFRNRPPDLNRRSNVSFSSCAGRTRELAWFLVRKLNGAQTANPVRPRGRGADQGRDQAHLAFDYVHSTPSFRFLCDLGVKSLISEWPVSSRLE